MAVTSGNRANPAFFRPIVAQRIRTMATASLRAGIEEMSRPQGGASSWDGAQAERYFVSLLRDELARRDAALRGYH